MIELGTSRRLSSVNLIANKLFKHKNIKILRISNGSFEINGDKVKSNIGEAYYHYLPTEKTC